MSSITGSMNTVAPEIVMADSLGQTVRRLVDYSKDYDTIILLYEDDFSDNVLASWAELDRIHLKTRKIGEILSGIEVHTFGMTDFPKGTVIELNIRESAQENGSKHTARSSYKSLLNEISLISVKVHQNGRGRMLLQ